MNILVVYPYLPYPLDRGTYQRTFHLLHELAQDHCIDLVAICEEGEGIEHGPVFEKFCRSVRLVPFSHPTWPKLISGRLLHPEPSTLRHWQVPQLAEAIQDQIQNHRYDLVHVCDIVMAQYFLREHRHVPLSIDRSRVDLQYQRQRARVLAGSVKDRLLAWENITKLSRMEKRIARRSQLQVLCGPDDEAFVRMSISQTLPLKVIPNGVDLDYFQWNPKLQQLAEVPTIMFCGAMDYSPNVDGLRWYFNEMHEALKMRFPDLEVQIVGKAPLPEVVAYDQLPGVHVTGSVPDVRPYYRSAWLQMVPLRIGGGTRLKIVESLAIGTPVVSTTIGAQGLDLNHGENVLLADSASAFVDEVAKALESRGLRDHLRDNGIATANHRFSWKRFGRELSNALVETVERSQRMTMMGIPFDRVTMQQSVDRAEKMIRERKPGYIATANVDFLVQARHDLELRKSLQKADMVVCDGTPLVWLSRLLGKGIPERVAGSDLVPRLLQEAAAKDWRVYFLGGSRQALSQAVRNVQIQYPSLQIVGSHSPPYAPLEDMDHEKIRSRIVAAKPDLLFVSFGCPKQEKWISRHHAECGVPVSVGVGATIDFLAGTVKRAPRWMQHCGMEWMYRLAQEPRRLAKRYATDLVVFALGAVSELIQHRSTARA